MALFNVGSLTKKGQALIAKSEATGAGIVLTKVKTGSGEHGDTSPAALSNLTELFEPKQEFEINSMSTIEGNSGVVEITVLITNRGLKELYKLNELGIYAEDPDDGEILYCILASEDNAIYLPPNNSMGISQITERILLEVTNADKTTINTSGALASKTEFDGLKKEVSDINTSLTESIEQISKNLRGGNTGQRFIKTSEDDYSYAWADSNTFTGARKDFPATGQEGSIYIDTDSSEIYVWKRLYTGSMGYFKLPLGAEASATLQAQITVNSNNILSLKKSVNILEAKQKEIDVTVDANWTESTSGELTVYTKEIAVTGMTADTEFDVLPNPISTDTVALDAEQKAIGIFWSHGYVDGGKDKITLTCIRKKPAVTFGMTLRGAIGGDS